MGAGGWGGIDGRSPTLFATWGASALGGVRVGLVAGAGRATGRVRGGVRVDVPASSASSAGRSRIGFGAGRDSGRAAFLTGAVVLEAAAVLRLRGAGLRGSGPSSAAVFAGRAAGGVAFAGVAFGGAAFALGASDLAKGASAARAGASPVVTACRGSRMEGAGWAGA